MSQELKITLLDKTLSVACPEGQAGALLESADMLNKQMLKVQKGKPTSSLLNVALISALNISYELLDSKSKQQSDNEKLVELSQRIEKSLSQQS
ncbi:MAG: cell division protein ZapA [Psychrobium sp.]|nr:cell division protein ZapA [Psychrobium sp.]